MAENQYGSSVELKGLDDVIKNIHILHERLQKQGARKAARKAMVPVREAARAGALTIDDPNTNDPSDPDFSIIAKNIVINESQRAGKREGGVVMRVGVRGGARSKETSLALAGPAPASVFPRMIVGRKSTGRVVGRIKRFTTHPGGETQHWRFVELGRQGIAARPFMRPALEKNIGQVVEILATELNAEIEKSMSTMRFIGPKPKP